jgi:capsular polysaccharide export protein
MILGRPVTFLGRTFYRSFDGDRLKKYIMRHLINIDYFGNEEVSVDTMKEVLSRI